MSREVWISADTFHIKRFVTQRGRKTLNMVVDYPEVGPKDIYALGVPRDAKIVDLTAAKNKDELIPFGIK